jgi:glycosyltransferase involved in cell wall biosynthesis
VIIPTFGEAPFARWAIESVQRQTVRDLQILIICDGSPHSMRSLLDEVAAQDPRIQVFRFRKSKRTGEPYRDLLIRRRARGANIFYCCHDDLWFPNHVEVLSAVLQNASFAHSLRASVRPDAQLADPFFADLLYVDLELESYRRRMLDVAGMENFFGLSSAAHTRAAYFRLRHGWATTPPGIWTDLHMWRKFLEAMPSECATSMRVSALTFPAPARRRWSASRRSKELAHYSQQLRDPAFIRKVGDSARSLVRKRRSGQFWLSRTNLPGWAQRIDRVLLGWSRLHRTR